MAAEKAARKPGRQLGPTGETVRKNIRAIRDRQGVSAAELSTSMGKLGRPIPPLGIQRIESGERRVDADDLVALAQALGVSPITLLIPEAQRPGDQVSVTGVETSVSVQQLFAWLLAVMPLTGGGQRELMEFLIKSVPAWQINEGNYPAVVAEGVEPNVTRYLRLPLPSQPGRAGGDDQ